MRFVEFEEDRICQPVVSSQKATRCTFDLLGRRQCGLGKARKQVGCYCTVDIHIAVIHRSNMKPILKFPKIIILSLVGILILVTAIEETHSTEDEFAEPATVIQVPLALDYIADPEEYYDHSESGVWPPEELIAQTRGARAMYLAQGVEFVFPIGVQYTLANVNEQLWPLGTDGFDGVLEFPRSKIAIMFSSMINTLKIANFSVTSRIYTPEEKELTTPLRILGTEVKSADFRADYKDTWTSINKEIADSTGGSIPEFIPRGGLYGRTIYPFTTAAFINSLHYENHWAFPWKDAPSDKFTDSNHVPYMEVEGLMPYYENDAFIAVAALFKSGTGSVVFLKPKGAVTILQLMLNPTALTQIFDENFPGWGVKQMRVRVPQASFTTNSQHFDMLVKRGVTNSFCVHETTTPPGSSENVSRYSLNPIVQTNHIKIAKETFSISSVTGVTLNNEKDLNSWNTRQRDDMAPETLLEEYTTPKEEMVDDDPESSTVISIEEFDSTTTSSISDDSSVEERSGLSSISLTSTEQTTGSSSSNSTSSVEEGDTKHTKKGDAPTTIDFYDFNEPFLWFLHAINEEPMFMGVIESFKRYLEETGNKENVQSGDDTPTSAASGLIDKNRWIYEAAKGVLWHCPSLINKQAE